MRYFSAVCEVWVKPMLRKLLEWKDITAETISATNPVSEQIDDFWCPLPWDYRNGMLWDASGDAIVNLTKAGKPYIEGDAAKIILRGVNPKEK